MPLLFVHNDLTKMSVDAVVNEIDPDLEEGGAINRAIRQAAGEKLQKTSRKLESCKAGDAVLTKGYDLPARYIIHTVSPGRQDGETESRSLLESRYTRCLHLAVGKFCRTVAFPLLSGCRRGDSIETVLDTAVRAITSYLKDHELTVYLVLSNRSAFSSGLTLFRQMKYFVDADGSKLPFEKPAGQTPDHAQTIILHDTGVIWYPADEKEQDAVEGLFHKKEEDSEPQSPKAEYAPTPQVPLPPVHSAEAKEAQATSPSKKPKTPLLISHSRKEDISKDKELTRILHDLDEGFSGSLLRLIDEKGMTDVQCYKKANISRKLFSKIRSDANYRPSKTTAVAFALALELTLPEAQELLARAGYTLSHSYKFDRIIEYCIDQKVYNVFTVNEALFAYDQSLLGG